MNGSTTLRRILLAPPSLRPSLLRTRTYLSIPTPDFLFARPSSSIPSITRPSLWASLIPKPLHNRLKSLDKKPRSKEWNPATFFIFIFMLIGSMSVQMIALRNSHEVFMRRSDAKIGLLREIIERIQKGEDVDVEGLLGTGDAKREKEWEEVLQEIEREDQAWNDLQRRKPTRPGKNIPNDHKAPLPDSQPMKMVEQKIEPEKVSSNAPKGFY